MRLLLPVALALAVLTPACREPGAAVPAEPVKAAAAAESGSAEGAMCVEHGVLEALCTKCHPALISVFKSKGDWCAEHGFPESICPICHPERGGRPVARIAADDAPADGTKVRFKTTQTARLTGIETVPALTGASESTCSASARIVYDAPRLAHVNARAPGVVRDLRVDVGAHVRPGAALAVIESAGVGADASSLRAARSAVTVAEAELARETRLRDEGIAAEREVQAAQREFEAARAAVSAAEAALGVVGTGADSTGRYTLTSPIAGVVVRRSVTIGQLVGVEDLLFEVVDTSGMWAEVDIPEADLPGVAAGQRVVLRVETLGDREFSGELAYVAPEISPRTRTAVGRVALANPEGVLRANMFAEARISVGHPIESVLVPRSAVQRKGDARFVFVRLAEDVYEVRRVRVLPNDGDLLAVSGRLRPGDEVATTGSFLLKTETLKESIGAGCCDVE